MEEDFRPNPLILTNSSTVMRVKHIDHGMYSTSNNVEIRNVSSGFTTTLNENHRYINVISFRPKCIWWF